MSKLILCCPNCDRSWSTRDCAGRDTVICECGFGIAVPDTRSKAIAAASCASEAASELLTFAREGNQLGDTAFAVSVGEKLADAFRLSIDAQGGPDDADEALFYTRILDYLDPRHIVRTPPQYEARPFKIPDGRWYICRAASDDLDEDQRFLSEPEAQGIVAMLNLAAPAGVGRTPLPTQEELRLAHAIVDSNPVLRVHAAPEWQELTEDAQQWAAVLIREARRALAPAVPADVAALVVAAREVLDEYGRESVDECQAGHDTLRQLDKAAEAFASRVCRDDDGGSLKYAHAVPCTCGHAGEAGHG